ncbi:hypothetical protein [Okeania sp. SIO1I7]|uniref:hypothetical protein n=1 Tax=Okeania sp. SIO1I7 TaxID=2607772 RepID=UPI0013FA56EF|nr:hypothetical protein [Okeania sp. SIO1I7]NET24175.1 hypothetical protein [Okeania sp. SIO1I7]
MAVAVYTKYQNYFQNIYSDRRIIDGGMGRWGPTPNPSQEGEMGGWGDGKWRYLYICTIKCTSY